MLVVSIGFLLHNFIINAPDHRRFLRAPQVHYAAEQSRPLTAGQDTATNGRSVSSDIIELHK